MRLLFALMGQFQGHPTHFSRQLVCGLTAMLLAACGQMTQSGTNQPMLTKLGGVVAAEGQMVGDEPVELLRLGDIAPDFAYRLPDDTTQRLSDLRDKQVILNFWATWCGPCIEEMPLLQQTADANASTLVLQRGVQEKPSELDRTKRQGILPQTTLTWIEEGAHALHYCSTDLPVARVQLDCGRYRSLAA